MSGILVVDDETSYCRQLQKKFLAAGFEVRSATDCSSGLELASLYQPDILLCDWMLGGQHTGLDLAAGVQLMNPAVQIILMTAYPAADVKKRCREINVLEIIEKPFHFHELFSSVKLALTRINEKQAAQHGCIGVISVAPDGSIDCCNSCARKFFRSVFAGVTLKHAREFLGNDYTALLESSEEDWIWVDIPATRGVARLLRSKLSRSTGGWIVVLSAPDRRADAEALTIDLWDESGNESHRLPYSRRGIILEHDQLHRSVLHNQLLDENCSCHTVQSYSEALKILMRDPLVGFMVLDADMPNCFKGDCSLAQFLGTVREIRPDIVLIGSSEINLSEQLIAAGVVNFLRKPWTVDNLLQILTQDRSPTQPQAAAAPAAYFAKP